MRREDERYYRSKLLLLDSDLEEFDRRLRARYPDLFIFEDNQDETLVRFYRTLAEAEYNVMFCETKPGWLREIEARDGPQTEMKDFLFDSEDTPWFFLNLSVIKREEFYFHLGWRIDRPEGEFRSLSAAEKGKVPGEFEFRYHRNDAAAERFLNEVRGIVQSFATNRFDWYNLNTGEFLETEIDTSKWAGPEVIRRGREDAYFYPDTRIGDRTPWPGRRHPRGWDGAKAVPLAEETE